MKFACFLILIFACAAATLPAQTNTATNGVESILALVTTNHPPAAPTNPPDAKPRYVHIQSTGPAVLDFDNHWVTYSDNVCVTNDQMKLTCEWIKAEFSAKGDQATNIVAETNVVIDFTDPKGKQGRAIGTNALYVFQVHNGLTNETVTLTGDPPEILEGPNYTNRTMTSKVVYDLITRRVTFDSPSGTYYGTTNRPTGTNSHGSDNLPSLK
jgi:lipopolysaccharide export system protein LptA